MGRPEFTYPLMDSLCKELNERTAGSKVAGIQPNDFKRFYLLLESERKREALFFCFSPQFLRFHLTAQGWPRNPGSLHPLHAYLANSTVAESRILQQDRILQIRFEAEGEDLCMIGEFFPKHPNYYLVKKDGFILFSLHHLGRSHYELPAKFARHFFVDSPFSTHREVERAYDEYEQKSEFDKAKAARKAHLGRELKRLQKKEKEMTCQLQACHSWESARHEGDLIKSNLSSIKKGASSITVQDWSTGEDVILVLNPKNTAQEEMAARFRHAKKLQSGMDHLNRFLEQVKENQKLLTQKLVEIEQACTLSELHSIFALESPSPSPKQQIKEGPKGSPIYREYVSASGLKIWVGKNDRANDRLTFQLANGNDWWFHIRGCPGSHVVMKVSKGQSPDQEALNDAMQLALVFSKAKSQGEGEVCVTQRKHLMKFRKGKPGQVQVSRHQSFWVKFDSDRYRALKERRLNRPL